MKIDIFGSSTFTVSDRMRQYIQKRVDKLNYFKAHINNIKFHLNSEKLIYKITATLNINKIATYKFEATAAEMYTAIDKIIHKMDVKINREKTRIQNHNNPDHEQIINFFYSHEENKPEPTRNIAINNKPSTLIDAYLQMKVENNDFFGFHLIHEDEKVAPAFLRRLEDNIVYLFKKDGSGQYSEYKLMEDGKNVSEGEKVRELLLKQMNLLDAQKDVLQQDYPFSIYFDNDKRINFLYKEGNGKWQLLS